ncbi:WD40 repeat protein [Spironucleus salmonicida]|uniref:WD40 repeat protein n=1 Tax=Spironucleus salmonicida TaxID=348837 RepID=V6LV98_9EUKA|nr:WD40 repeat protein [Spironucleus salmonicida]|eukprot:EST47636.1 hypothetical protein SS50377_12331 [Spironucleus salmonicida]
MLSTSFVFKRISYAETQEQITKVAWNRTDGWLAFGGDMGLLRIIMLEFQDQHDFNLQGVAARPSRVSIDRRLTIHEGSAITTITWNETKEQVTTGDNRGSVVVCGYQSSKWSSEFVNESVQSPVVTAVWASDSSKVLIFYQSGQILLGASTGHKILSMQVRQQEQAKFAFVTDSRVDIFMTGWETKIIAYNFDSTEKYRIQLGAGDKFVAASLLEFKENKEDPKIVAITMQGELIIYNAVSGVRLISAQISIIPTDVQVSPNAQYIAVSGQALEPHGDLQGSSGPVQSNADQLAVVKLYRTKDLEHIATIRIQAKIATCISWDASSLRLAIGTDGALYLACLRLSYRHFMLQDGTVVYSSGSSIIKTSNQIVSAQNTFQKDECITFWKNPSTNFHQRYPQQFIDQCACGPYLAMLCGRSVLKQDGSYRQLSNMTLHSSVGAPTLSLDLNYTPFFMAGCENYLVTASPSRISIYDIRFLTGEIKSENAQIETKLDQGQNYTGIIEWHADSSPFAADRELHVAKLSVSAGVTAVSISNNALFVARQNATIQRFNLPSLQSNVNIHTGTVLRVIRCNCNGTAVAGVNDDGFLSVQYTSDFITGEIKENREVKDAKKSIKMIERVEEEEKGDDLSKMLGFDGAAPKSTYKESSKNDKPVDFKLPQWDTQLTDIWGICWNNEDANMLAISSKHKIFVLQVNKKVREEPITSSAHILAFQGLIIHGVYLDEAVMYGAPMKGSYKQFETQQLRDLKEQLYGKVEEQDEIQPVTNLIKLFGHDLTDYNVNKQTPNVTAGFAFLQQQVFTHPHLYKIVAEAALRDLQLDIASQCFVRASDYISYHFTEYIRRIGSDELRKAEVAVFLSDFKLAEHILTKQLGRVDLSLKNDEELGMWMKVLQQHKDAQYNVSHAALITDELANQAHRQVGQYYMRIRRYADAVSFLSKSDDISLLAEALYRAEQFDELRTLATSLQPDTNTEAILAVSKILSRIGDVEGASVALLRLNRPEEAIKTCITLKRFDKAILIAQEFEMLETVDKHLSEYLRQLLSAGDDKAALDLLRKTNQGEIAACIIISAAMENLKQAIDARTFPLNPSVFNRVRRLIVLAGKEATTVQRSNINRDLRNNQNNDNALLTQNQTNQTMNQLLHDDVVKDTTQQQSTSSTLLDDPLFAKFGNHSKSTNQIWRLVKQTRYIVLASYMLYVNKPQQALFPAIEAAGFYYKLLQNSANLDEEFCYFAKIALPIAVFAALQIEDFDLASQLMEVLEADDEIPSIERDQLEQLAVDVFSKFPPNMQQNIPKEAILQCEKCKNPMQRYSTVCVCGYQANLCSRTGMVIKQGHKIQKCGMCSTMSTIGKSTLQVCPMCHEQFE